MSYSHDAYQDVPLSGRGRATRESWPEERPNSSAPKSQHLKTIVFALLGLALVWQITTRSLVAYLADTSPEAALNLRPGDATALINLAEIELKLRQKSSNTQNNSAASTSPTVAQGSAREIKADAKIRAAAEAALFDEPLNARALGILGQLAVSSASQDKDRTAQLMAAAARLSTRETGALFWLMQNSYERRDYDKTIDYADKILNTRPQMARYVVPFLARIAESKSAAPTLEKLIAHNPKWRGQFFLRLPQSISDARTPLGILLSLKNTQTPATTLEIRSYLSFLIGKKFYEIAYYTWLQFLSPEQLGKAGYLFNGSFETAPGGLPFDWIIKQGSSVTIDIADHPDEDDRRALFIEFGHGRVQFGGVRQLIMLAPGTYRLEGRYKGQIIGRRGLVWRMRCVGDKWQVLGESPMFVGVERKWKSFETTFTVPHTGCRVQQVRLQLDARSASEQLVTGGAWYDDLRISRGTRVVKTSQ